MTPIFRGMQARGATSRTCTNAKFAALADLAANKTGDINGIQFFWSGMEVVFNNNLSTAAGPCRNNSGVCCGIVTHSDEPADDGQGNERVLKYVPLAIMVGPSMRAIGALYSDLDVAVPVDCMPVSQADISFTLTIPERVEQAAVSYTVRRTGIPLGNGYAVTVYFTQGMSFRDACWIAHGLQQSAAFRSGL